MNTYKIKKKVRRNIDRTATCYMNSEKVESTLEWRNETNGDGRLSIDTVQVGGGVRKQH